MRPEVLQGTEAFRGSLSHAYRTPIARRNRINGPRRSTAGRGEGFGDRVRLRWDSDGERRVLEVWVCTPAARAMPLHLWLANSGRSLRALRGLGVGRTELPRCRRMATLSSSVVDPRIAKRRE